MPINRPEFEPTKPRILILDWAQQRGELLAALLRPLADVAVQDHLELGGTEPGLVVVDAPTTAREEDWWSLKRRVGRLPILALGAGEVPEIDGLTCFGDRLHPSTLVAAAARLLAPGTTSVGWHVALAALVPLSEGDRTMLDRARKTTVPILLAGPRGTGKSLLARALLTADGDSLTKVRPPLPRPLTELLAEASTSGPYIGPVELLSPVDQATLLDFIEESQERRQQIVLATNGDLSGLDGDLRVRIDPVRIDLRPLAEMPAQVNKLFQQVLGLLASHHDLEPPLSTANVASSLRSHSWPGNFEELIATATRLLFRATGRPAQPDDLGFDPDQEPGHDTAGMASSDTPTIGSSTARNLDELAQELAHAIRNPLVSIKALTQLLVERFDEAEFREEYSRIVVEDVDRIDAVLTQVVEFSRLRQPDKHDLDLRDVLREIILTHEYQARKQGIELSAELPDDETHVHTDSTLLTYALSNTLTEALTTLNQGDTLALRLRERTGEQGTAGVRIAIEYGLASQSSSPEAEATRRRIRQVLGLRNALAARAIELLGGRLTIEDTLDGRTFVTVDLDAH